MTLTDDSDTPLSTKLWLESHIVSNGILLCSVHFLIQLPGNMRICPLSVWLFFLPKCNNMECWRQNYITEKDKCFFVYSLNTFVLQMYKFFSPHQAILQCSVDTNRCPTLQFSSDTVCLGLADPSTGSGLSPKRLSPALPLQM